MLWFDLLAVKYDWSRVFREAFSPSINYVDAVLPDMSLNIQ